MKEAKERNRPLHVELKLYFICHNAWNIRKYKGPIKVYKRKVTAFYTNVFKQRCEVFLGSTLPEATDYCKRQEKRWEIGYKRF